MYEIYIGNKNYSSWSLRPWVLMKELGISFEEQLVPFGTMEGTYQMTSPTGGAFDVRIATFTLSEPYTVH